MAISIDSKRVPEVQCERDHECPRTVCNKTTRRRTGGLAHWRSELQPQECEPGVGVLAVLVQPFMS